MAIDVMMQLGGYQFSVNTAAYQELRRNTDFKWSAQDLIGRLDALQFTGPGQDTITVQGAVFPHFKGGTGQLDAMRAEASKGKPLLLVDGRGRVHGLWIIERIEETQAVFAQAGVPLRQGFNMQLRKYGDGVTV